MLQFGIASRRYLQHLVPDSLDDRQVRAQVMVPGGQIHVGQTDAHLTADFFALVLIEDLTKSFVVIRLRVLKCGREVSEAGVMAGVAKILDLREGCQMKVLQPFQGETKGLDRTF